MFKLNNLKFGTKILLLGIGSVLITIAALVGTVVWQSAQFNALAQEQFAHAAEADLGHIAEGAYNVVEAQDQVVQEQANSGLNVVQLLIHDAGGAKLADEKVDWQATNEATQQTMNVQLPKMYVGDTWLGKLTGRYDTTPIVDHAQLLVGGNATIYQRMNEEGDMLRVATNGLLPNGQRAIGTYVPAVHPDGTPNPAVAAILRNSIYRGSNFIIDAWYNAAYAPIRDESGQVIGMLQVGMKQENVDAARQAILRTQVGETGNVDVLGSDGDSRGRYIISRKGQRDGESVWDTHSVDGSFPIQSLIEKAVALKFGEVAIERYQWQDPSDPAPRSKVAGVTYYEPWHWVIVASMDESEIQAYQRALEEGQMRMIVVASAVGVALALIAGFLSVLIARSIARPVIHLADVATQVSGGNLQVVAKVEERDEIGTLATAFNTMTGRLRDLIDSLETRVEIRTAQMRASADVGRAVTSILNPDDLFKQIVGLITERFGFYYAAVFVLDEEHQQAVLRAATGEAGRILLERGHHLPVDEKSMVGTAIITSSHRIALDVGQGAVRFANPLLPNTRSEIALPLIVGDQVLGALDVQSEQAGVFDESGTKVLQAMADQIAVALLNAETFQRSEQQTNTMALLNRLSRNLASATSLEDIALLVLPIVNDLMGQSYVAVVQKTANPQVLALREFTANSDRPVSDSEPIQTAGSLIGECIERREAIYAADLSTLIDKYSDVANLYRQGLGSGAVLPLRVGERVLGTLNVGTQQAHAYSAELINQLEQIAAQLAVTIENLNLVEQAQQTVAELDAANRQLVGQAWGQYSRTAKLEAAEWRNGTWSVLESRAGPRDDAQAVVSAAPPLSLPIKVRGTTIGEFSITAADARQIWDAEEMTFAQSLVDQVGQVLETARLLDETERAAQREKAVAEAADRIHRSTDIDTVLRSAVTELHRITGRRGISVQLGFGGTNSTLKSATASKREAASGATGNGQATRPEGDQANA